jgi:hypothetical protein
MKIVRTRSGKYANAWFEGNTVTYQDLKTGKTRTVSRKHARTALRETRDMRAAREYANG